SSSRREQGVSARDSLAAASLDRQRAPSRISANRYVSDLEHCRPAFAPISGNRRSPDRNRATCITMSDAAPILNVAGLGKRFGGFVALESIDLAIDRGERLGLIGPNGSGKSTLVNCLCGTLHNETGSVAFDGQRLDGLIAHERTRLGLARSFQL